MSVDQYIPNKKTKHNFNNSEKAKSPKFTEIQRNNIKNELNKTQSKIIIVSYQNLKTGKSDEIEIKYDDYDNLMPEFEQQYYKFSIKFKF